MLRIGFLLGAFGQRMLANAKALCRLAPYERRVIELLRNSKDKRARKLAKKRVCCYFHLYPVGVALRASSLGAALHRRRNHRRMSVAETGSVTRSGDAMADYGML